MKKRYFYLLLLGLFFLIPNANAKTINVGIDFESNERFNFFYEAENQTNFYKLLVENDSDINTYLNSLDEMVSTNNATMNFLVTEFYDQSVFPVNTHYVIGEYLESSVKYSYTGDIFYITGNTFYNYYCFDENANYLGYITNYDIGKENEINLTIEFDLSGKMKEKSSNFTYMISKTYYLSNSITIHYNVSSWPNVIVTDIYANDLHYLIDNSTEYSSFKAFWRKLFDWSIADDFDFDEGFLDYFRYNKVISSDNRNVRPLYKMLNTKTSNPYFHTDMKSLIAGLKDSSYYFYRKTNDLLNSDLNIYVQTSSELIEVSVFAVDISTTTPVLLEDCLVFKPPVNEYYKINLGAIKKNNSEETIEVGGKYMYYIYVNSLKYETKIYYDETAYNYGVYDSSNTSFSISNPYGDGTITINKTLFSKGIVNAGVTSSTLNNSTGNNIFEQSGITVDNVATTLVEWVKSFIGIISTLFSLIFMVFATFPIDLQMLFYFGFLSGMIIILVKLIRG